MLPAERALHAVQRLLERFVGGPLHQEGSFRVAKGSDRREPIRNASAFAARTVAYVSRSGPFSAAVSVVNC